MSHDEILQKAMVTDVWTNQKPRGWTFISVFIMLLIKLQAHFSTALTRDVTKLSRIFVADSLQLDAPYQIDEKNCHYITSVMRLKVGSSFRIFNGRDGEFLCDLQSIAKNKKSAQGVLSRQIRSQTEDRRLPIILYCASLKKPRMKLLLEKVLHFIRISESCYLNLVGYWSVRLVLPYVDSMTNSMIDFDWSTRLPNSEFKT